MGAAREESERKEGGRERRGEREEIEVGRTARGSRGVCGGDKSSKQYVFINIRYMYVCSVYIASQ